MATIGPTRRISAADNDDGDDGGGAGDEGGRIMTNGSNDFENSMIIKDEFARNRTRA